MLVVLAMLAPLVPLVVSTAPVGASDPLPPPAEGSVLLGCDQADERVQVTVTSHLDPSCTYTKGLDVVASDVTLDCQGALIESAPGAGGRGIQISSPTDVTMTGVTVRHCRVAGFLNSLRVTRDGFRDLESGEEYLDSLSDVVIEDSRFTDSRGVGVFVDGYVSGVTLRRSEIRGAGSSGVYLETGSKDNVVENNVLHDNGYRENGSPEGQLYEFGGVWVRFWGPGREGLSIDGSYGNVVRGNSFEGNSAGGIFVYKNCGEYPSRPAWFDRRWGSFDNLIEGNAFEGGRDGVWVGSRMGENTLPMECSEPAYIEQGIERFVEDWADNNVVRGNTFNDVMYGIRVEDDDITVEDNVFTGPDATHHAITVGTRKRTFAPLFHPVERAAIRNNVSTIAGNPHPFRWIYGVEDLVAVGNVALGAPVGMCEGGPIPHNLMVMVQHVVAEDPEGPPTPKPDYEVPILGELDPCPGPDAPTWVNLVGGVRQVRIEWAASTTDPGDPIVGYDVLDEGGTVVATTSSRVRSVDVIGLEPSGGETFRVRARSLNGTSAPSEPSAAVAVLPLTGPVPTDLGASAPFVDEIIWALQVGLLEGFGDGALRPDHAVTRQTLAALLHRWAGSPPVALPEPPTFPDVPADHPFAGEIEWLAALGVSAGFDDGTFGGTRVISRQSLAALLYRLAGSPPVAAPGPAGFVDVPADHAFVDAIEWLRAESIAAGRPDGTFRPTEPVSRKAAAAFLYRFSARVPAP